jgi:AraC-like DNA-binding protein
VQGLAARCLAHGPRDGANPTAVDGVWVYRRSAAGAPERAVYEPSLILVLQGRKQAQVGDEVFVYDPDHYLVTSVPLPVVSQIVHASPARPFVSLAVDFELEEVRELMARVGLGEPAAEPPQRGLASCPVTPQICDIAGRLVALLEAPADAPVLGPLLRRELLYRVLTGPRGGFLRAAAAGLGQQRAIAEVLQALHADCARPVSVPQLAAAAGMSESAFYVAFKAVTAETPLQYVKRLRLQEAHRQLSLGLSNVSGAAYGVGYHSRAQFSRDFARVFGAPPSAVVPR